MSNQPVADEEALYRRVLPNYYQTDSRTGLKRLSPQVFSDRELKISVDRAILCANNPNYTKKSDNDGVLSLITGDIRAINNLVRLDAKGNVINDQVVNVDPDPINNMENDADNNPAHALIYATPDFDSRPVFKRLIESLTLISNWEILPTE